MEQLEVLLHHHPNFPRFKSNMKEGITYPIQPINEQTRIDTLNKQLEKGNHKSTLGLDARKNTTKSMKTDVIRGFGFIMSKRCASRLKEAEIYPLGMQHQTTINEIGKSIPKKRLTHDLSANRRKGLSINQRVIEEEVPPVMFGYTLQRVLTCIHQLRFNHPNERILLNKVDIEKAYRRLHTTGDMAAKCIAIWHLDDIDEKGNLSTSDEEIAVALGRLPFGSSPAPAEFSNASDIVFDLASDLMQCEHWSPDELPCPLKNEIPPTKRLPDNIPFGKAYQADVDLGTDYKGSTDGYIDDGANVVLDSEENKEMVKRAEQCLPMALHLIFRPNAGELEPIQRSEMASIPKLKAEAYLTEIMTLLGWEINTRAFTIALPLLKYKNWSDQIRKILKMKRVTYNEMATLVGRLNHAAYIIPAARHFMNRIRRLEEKADKYRTAKMTKEVSKDLHLWLKFLEQAHKGISINNVVFRKPTSTSLSDSCERGIGGYSHDTGLAWRYEFTLEEQISFDINQKKYLASAINQKIQLEHDNCSFPCSNDITDNTSATAWMYKSNFDPDSHPINNEIARENAKNLIEKKASSFSQHIKGSLNDIADSLSRDFHLTNNQLISLFNFIRPPYFPKKQMRIINLPKEITSWIASLAQLRTKKRELNWGPTPSSIAHGIIGWSGPNTSGLMTPSFDPSTPPKEYAWPAPSSTQCDEETSLPTGIVSKARPLKRPSIMWRRPSSQVKGKTHASTTQAKQAS